MTQLGNWLCLLLGLLIPAVGGYLILQRALRPLAAASSYRNVAWRLGLEADTRGTFMQGSLDGRRIWVGELVDEATGRKRVRAVLDFTYPLGLGLRARSRERRGAWRRTRRDKPAFGDPELDAMLMVSSPITEQVRPLFTEPVRSELLALHETWSSVEMNDQAVVVLLKRAESSDKRLTRLVDSLRRLAAELEAARLAMPAPEGAAGWVAPWRELAQRIGLATLDSLPALSGTLDGHEVAAHAMRRDDHFVAEAFIGFREHLSTGLRIESRAPGELPRIGAQDITTGDRAFDIAFGVRGYDPPAIQEALTAEVRQQLTQLASHGQVSLDDEGITVAGLPPDTDALEAVLRLGVRVGAALGW